MGNLSLDEAREPEETVGPEAGQVQSHAALRKAA